MRVCPGPGPGAGWDCPPSVTMAQVAGPAQERNFFSRPHEPDPGQSMITIAIRSFQVSWQGQSNPAPPTPDPTMGGMRLSPPDRVPHWEPCCRCGKLAQGWDRIVDKAYCPECQESLASGEAPPLVERTQK